MNDNASISARLTSGSILLVASWCHALGRQACAPLCLRPIDGAHCLELYDGVRTAARDQRFLVRTQDGPLHAACLQSFVRQGHRVVLHTGRQVEGCPKGVDLADASILLSRDKVVPHKRTGSYALASDIFRFELQAAEAGIYVDCDCYCVFPLDEEDFVLGRANDDGLNCAVLRLPADSPLLEAMLGIATLRGFVPPWLQGGAAGGSTQGKRLAYPLLSRI